MIEELSAADQNQVINEVGGGGVKLTAGVQDLEEEVRTGGEMFDARCVLTTSTPFLYDTVITHALTWPSLTCQWLPDREQWVLCYHP